MSTSNTINVGRRLIAIEQIALVEPFEPSAENPLRSEREFKTRIILLNRDSVLAEVLSSTFVEEQGFRMLEEDAVATNPAVNFAVEAFEPYGEFHPSKPFRSRIVWRDLDGNTQSKLLLSSPETVLTVAVRGGEKEGSAPDGVTKGASGQKPQNARWVRRRVMSPRAPVQS